MSEESMKIHRTGKHSKPGTVDENASYISSDQLLDYLRTIMSRYCGYQYISLSKPGKPNRIDGKLMHELLIAVHRNLPYQDKFGMYRSDKDQFVRAIWVEQPGEFNGLVMDRNKHYVFGNPFPTFKQEPSKDLPNVGNPPSIAAEFNDQDETAEPI